MTPQTALAPTNVQSLANEFGYKESFVQTVIDTFAKGANENELRLFMQTAKRTGLDPFARQIYCIKRWDSALQKEVMSAQVSIDGFRLIADRSGSYVPSKEPTFNFDKNGNLESATAYIKKFVGGVWHEISATAFYSEYVQTKKDKTPTSMWLKMPRLMLAKCAESLVLRKAFPAELSGLYTPEEMGSADNIPTPETAQTNFQPAIEAAKVEVVFSPAITEEIQTMRVEIETWQNEMKPDATEKVLNWFDPLGTYELKVKAHESIRSKNLEYKTTEIKDALATSGWEIEAIDKFLADKHGLDKGVDFAHPGQIDVLYKDLLDSKMILKNDQVF